MPTKDAEKRKQHNRTYYLKNKERRQEANRQERVEARDFVWSLKIGPCTDCGNTYPPYVMDFDHINGDKEINVAEAANRRWSKERILQEIEKCELVCANCHRIRTYTRMGHKHLSDATRSYRVEEGAVPS